MPTEFVKGDLFAAPGLDALAHGCNCAGAMGKGIAVEFKRRFPEMYAEYKQRCELGRFKLGDVFMWTQSGTVVFNLGTQQTWRTKAELQAVSTALKTMVRLAEQAGLRRIGLPRIGAGLGGLDWQDVRAELAALGAATSLTLVVFEEFEPARRSREPSRPGRGQAARVPPARAARGD